MLYCWRANNAPDVWSALVLHHGALLNEITNYWGTIEMYRATASVRPGNMICLDSSEFGGGAKEAMTGLRYVKDGKEQGHHR